MDSAAIGQETMVAQVKPEGRVTFAVARSGPERGYWRTKMDKLKRSVVAFFGLLTTIIAIPGLMPHSGFGQNQNGATQLNCDQPPCDAVARGRAAFNSRNLKDLGGNGRACSDCHMPSEGFQLSPASARARFDALVAALEHNRNADDPLFRPVDADDFRVNGDNA